MLLQRSGPALTIGRIYKCHFCIKRYKNKNPDHWANKLRKTNPANLALKHFDEFYKKLFERDWPSVRIALLTQHKYMAVVNNFGDSEKTMEQLEGLGALNVRQIYEIYKDNIKKKQEGVNKNEKSRQKDILNMTQSIEDIQPQSSASNLEAASNEQVIQRPRPQIERNEEDDQIEVEKRNLNDFYKDKKSLHESLEQAEFDNDRIINTKLSGEEALFDFIPATELKGMDDFITDSEYIGHYRSSSEVDFKTVLENELNISPYLHVYSFPMGDVSEFPSPRRGITGVLNYYCMNGSSLLPVLALDIKPFDTVLDMCAAPGGKTLVALQTLYPELIVANDITRSKRLIDVMNQYIYDFNPKSDKRVRITKADALLVDEVDTYDKILVDVPCTNDRLSVTDDFNNIFNPMKLKDRLNLPELQSKILTNALKLVKVGGSVVYSTCSLSPIQNDGVVQMALKNIWEETDFVFEIKDLSPALKPLKTLFSFANINLSCGHLIKPYLPNNFGPLYFCKLDKIK